MRGRQRRPSLAPFPRRPLSTGLSSAEGEIIKIRVSQLNGCVFCLDLHSRQARKLGVPQQKLDLLPAWRESTLFSDREAALLAVAETATTLPLSEDSKADLLAARNTLGQETEPPEVSCRIFLSQEGWHHAKENRSRCEGAGVASAA